MAAAVVVVAALAAAVEAAAFVSNASSLGITLVIAPIKEEVAAVLAVAVGVISAVVAEATAEPALSVGSRDTGPIDVRIS